jgi:hypothetical protein
VFSPESLNLILRILLLRLNFIPHIRIHVLVQQNHCKFPEFSDYAQLHQAFSHNALNILADGDLTIWAVGKPIG